MLQNYMILRKSFFHPIIELIGKIGKLVIARGYITQHSIYKRTTNTFGAKNLKSEEMLE